MALILAAIQALAGIEQHKALAASLQAELGELVNVEGKDLASRVAKGEQAAVQLVEVGKTVKELEEKAKGVDTLTQKVNAFEDRDRTSILNEHFAATAKTHGIKADALATAQALIDMKGIKVDLEKRSVSGLTKELFEGLKAKHAVLFEVAVDPNKPAPAAAAPTIPALPPAGGSTAAGAHKPEMPGAVGYFLKAQAL